MSAWSAAWPIYFDRAGAGRPAYRTARGAAQEAAARFRVAIELAELLPVASVGERGQRQVGNARFLVLGFGCRLDGTGRGKSRQPREGIIPPGAVVVAAGHRLAELAVVGNVDAEFALRAHHVGDRGGKALRIGGLVGAVAGGARPADGDEIRRPRQTARMGGENAIRAVFHGPGTVKQIRRRCYGIGCSGASGPSKNDADVLVTRIARILTTRLRPANDAGRRTARECNNTEACRRRS